MQIKFAMKVGGIAILQQLSPTSQNEIVNMSSIYENIAIQNWVIVGVLHVWPWNIIDRYNIITDITL